MADKLHLAIAQLDLVVGDVVGNTDRILEYCTRAKDEMGADLAVPLAQKVAASCSPVGRCSKARLRASL